MTEQQTPANEAAHDPFEGRRKGRRLIFLGAAGLAALAAAAVYVNLAGSRPLRVAKETTYITEPLKSDGKQVDYFAAIRQAARPENAATDENGYRLIVRHLGKGPEAEPWYFARLCEELGLDAGSLRPDTPYQETYVFLDAYVKSDRFEESLFDQLSQHDEVAHDEFRPAPTREDVQWMLDEKLARPWTLDELPMMADWLQQSGPALDLVGRAVRRPTFHVPLVRQSEDDTLSAVLSTEIQQMRSFARGLSARANYRIGTGDIDGAIDDIVACKRLGRHVGHGPTLIDFLVGLAIEGIAEAQGIAGSLDHPPSKEQLERLLAEMDRLPPVARVEDKVLVERFCALDAVQTMSDGKKPMNNLGLFGWNPPPIVDHLSKLSIDWNVVARRFNERFDEAQATGELPAREVLTPADAIPLLSLRARSEYVGEAIATVFWPGSHSVQEAVRRRECVQQVRRIALAMLLYEREHGTLPPAHSADAQGNALHSWRVLLLPYLGHAELHARIRLDEPWDSPHNRQFHGEAVGAYRCPSHPDAGPGETTYSVVVGPDMPFEAGEGKRLSGFGPDSDDMILVVERTDPIVWMDPTRELTQAAAELGIWDTSRASPPDPGRIGSHHPGVAVFGLRSGAVIALWGGGINFDLFGNLLRGTHTGPIED